MGAASRTAACALAAAAVVACGDLQQAATGGGPGSEDGSVDTEAGSSSTAGSADEGGGGTGTGATSLLDTGAPGEGSGTTVALDDTGSSGEPAGSDSSGDDAPVGGMHDGTYSGLITAQFQVDDQSGSCMGPITLTVAEGAAPQVSGTSSCSVGISVFTFDIVSAIEGTITSPMATGTMSANINGTPESTTWDGAFAVDTMTATFAGDFPQGPYTVTYTGSWSITR